MAVAVTRDEAVEPVVPVDPGELEKERRARAVRDPVGWLLGPDLISKLKLILRKRSDPRDWMPYYRGHLHDERHGRKGNLVELARSDDRPAVTPLLPARSAAASTRQDSQSAERVAPLAQPEDGDPEQDVWFDYVADMGDGVDSMYAVAYASMISFDRAGAPVAGAGAPGDAAAATETWLHGARPEQLAVAAGGARGSLPRGQFLFVGGDTAYHVADAATLRARVEEPFDWAFADACWNGHLAAGARKDRCTRRIYGIPGNHDWYDNLRGFSLVFRLGSRSPNRTDEQRDPIDLPELERVQLASYAGILLPYGWQLWGLDIDSPMDARQQAYFESLAESAPQRLIVATPSPGIVFGASIAGAEQRRVREQLKIQIPTVPVAPGAPVSPAYRLDISGDVHHYARYYPRPGVAGYGSVVSGLGGAFHHPSFTRASDTDERIEPEIEYPTPERSRAQIGAALLRPFSTLRGSWAPLLLIVLTLICGFAATRSDGGAWIFDRLRSVAPGFTPPAPGGSRAAVLRAACALAVGLLAVAGVLGGLAFGRRVYRRQVEAPQISGGMFDVMRRPGPWYRRIGRLFSVYRSYWFAWTIAVAGTAPFVLYPFWGGAPGLRLDVVALVLVLGLPFAGGLIGWSVGAQHLSRGRKALVALVGFVHAAAQMITAILCARLLGTSWTAAAGGLGAVAFATAMLWAARPLFHGERRRHAAGLALLALVVFMGAMLLLVNAAGGECMHQGLPLWREVACYAGSGVVAMLFGATWFAWYLAVAGRLHAHNNELGGAARVTAYRQLIRFHVHRGGLTGYVISVENRPPSRADRKGKAANQGGKHLAFDLVDVFTIAAPAGATQLTGSSTPDPLELAAPMMAPPIG